MDPSSQPAGLEAEHPSFGACHMSTKELVVSRTLSCMVELARSG